MPLDRAFWRYAVAGGLAVNLVTSVLFLMFLAAKQTVAAVVVGYALSLPYNLLAFVGVWRAAERDTGPRARANLYRIVTLVGVILLSAT